MDDLLLRIEAEIPRLRRYARHLTRGHDRADDLVQDCLARAIAKRDTWEPGTNLQGWLFTILRNGYISEFRRYSRRGPELELAEGDGRCAVKADQEMRLHLQEVAAAFDVLSSEHREVLQLVAIEGLKYEEVAKILGVPVGTVRSRLSRARAALRLRLENGRFWKTSRWAA
jgi:RNA polymerase sigma-70 factor (ECF subfamily)